MRGMEPDEARGMATRIDGVAADLRTAHINAYTAMTNVYRFSDPAPQLPSVATSLTTWAASLRAASDTVERRTDLIQMLSALSGVSGMQSVRRALEEELHGTMEATVIDEVAPVIITGATTPSAGNSQIIRGDEETFEGEDGTMVQLLGDEVDFAVAVDSETFNTAIGDFTFSAVGADGEAAYWVGVSSDGLEVGASAAAEVYLVQGEYGLDTSYLDLGAQVSVGAEAELVGAVEFKPLDGDLHVEAGVEAGASVSVGGEVQVGTEDFNVSGGAGIGAGAGVEATIDAGFEDWVFNFETDFGVYLGVGGELDFGFELDVGALGSGAVDLGKDVIGGINSVMPWSW